VLFSARVSERDGWAVVEVRGDLDLASAPRFRGVGQQLAVAPALDVAVDLRETDVVDSVGLGLLLGLGRRVRASGGRFVLLGARPAHLRLVEACGLSETLPARATLPLGEPAGEGAGP
jgi:anti-anti-sigma factor